jgi:hypothetical protein
MRYLSMLPIIFVLYVAPVKAQHSSAVGLGWAKNSVNTVIFRKNSLVTVRDTQFIAYYNEDRFVVLGKRKLGTDNWVLKQTAWQGNAADAHNTISLMADGDGFLHMAWDHHGSPLHYARSLTPCSFEFGPMQPMTGVKENQVTYPEFHRMVNGDLIFIYRDGRSGQGNLIINKYSCKSKRWKQLSDNLIDGEGQRNPYTQTYIDKKGTIHISWVWRESPNVATNHDMCYARSVDGGETWQTSAGKKYTLPITQASAEYVVKIPQNSELINQSSMTADDAGRPFIATYWRESNSTVPQYHVIYQDANGWKINDTGFLTTPFSLSGGGTKKTPISRPQILVEGKGRHTRVLLVFRSTERGDKPSMAISDDIMGSEWRVTDLSTQNLGSWEPTFDTELWRTKHIINLFTQYTEQVDGEGKSVILPQMISVLTCKP